LLISSANFKKAWAALKLDLREAFAEAFGHGIKKSSSKAVSVKQSRPVGAGADSEESARVQSVLPVEGQLDRKKDLGGMPENRAFWLRR